MRHPFERLSLRSLTRAGALAVSLSVLLGVLMYVVAESGPGFESLSELVWAGTPARAEAVVSAWTASQAQGARLFAALHGPFVLVLFNALALCTCCAARVFRASPALVLGSVLAWLAWLCVLAEIGEALAMHRLVRGSLESPWPEIAAASTWLQHAVLYVGSGYLAIALVAWSVSALGRRAS